MSAHLETPNTSEKQRLHWPSVLQFSLSLMTTTLLLVGAVGLILTGLYFGLAGLGQAEALQMLLVAASFLGIGVLMMPSVYYSLFRVIDRPVVDLRAILWRLRPTWWLLLYPFVVLIGLAAERLEFLTWLVLPLLHGFALGIPIAWMLALTIRKLPLGSSQRFWGVLGAGLSLGPLVISVLEILGFGLLMIGVGIYIAGQPEIMQALMNFVEAAQSGEPTPEELMGALGPYLTQPGVILTTLIMMAVFVPLVEEALKPVGVWLLAGRPLSAPAGFVAGALSGAGFALTESLLSTSSGANWVQMVLVRTGTAAIHILTAALTGWALAVAWKRRRYLTLAAVYLIAVIIHGLWNGLTITTVFAQLTGDQVEPGLPPVVQWLGMIGPAALAVMAAGALLLLVLLNHRLARPPRIEAGPEVVEALPRVSDEL